MELYRATHPGDPCGRGSHWTASLEDAEYWRDNAGGGCGGPVIVTREVDGRTITADEMDEMIGDDHIDGRLADADWEPDWIGEGIYDLPEDVVAVETTDDRGRTAYVLAADPDGEPTVVTQEG